MRKLCLYIFLLSVSVSCVEKIDVALDETYTRLVIDGSIATDTGNYVVHLTKTANYFYNAPSPRVVNATVNISDGSMTYNLKETEPGKSGMYETDSAFCGIIGKTYTLNVTLAQPVGDNLNYSASCQLLSVARLDSTIVVFNPDWGEDGFWEIKCYAQEPGDQVNYYMFNLFRNGRLLSDSISKVVVSDDKYFNGSYINGLGAFYIDNSNSWERLYPGDTIILQMSGITEEYYNFISEVQAAGFNIPFFVGPPANVVGNINNGAVGFFAAYSNSYATTIVK